jgi:hypothetical protein
VAEASGASAAEAPEASAGEPAAAAAEDGAAAETAPAPATTATVAEVPDLERLRSLWPQVLERIREGSELLAHALDAARPIGVDASAGIVELGFPTGASFNKRKAESPEARERIGEALRAVTGAPLRPACVLTEQGEAEEEEAAAGAALDEEELIALLKAEFDAEELGAEPEASDRESED